MEVVHERCCGRDIHKKLIVACAITPGDAGQPRKQLRTFGTMTDELQQLSGWLSEQGVTHVAMESTGSFWKPIFNVLEDSFELLLVNAQHLRAVPGRKTDVKDAEWIADLLRHGLLKASFIPDRDQRELRELVRYRTSVVQERTAAANRLQKVLEGANVKLASVATNILGRSGREMLEALVAGETNTAKPIADQLAATIGSLAFALGGSMTAVRRGSGIHLSQPRRRLLQEPRRQYGIDGFGAGSGGTTAPVTFLGHWKFDANETGWKDTLRVNPGELVSIALHFDSFTARYMYHCHLLVHEDHDMMQPFVVMPASVLAAMGDMAMRFSGSPGNGCATAASLQRVSRIHPVA